MPMPRMSKTTKLLNHDPDLSDSYEAVYVTPTTVCIPLIDWDDLDRPDTITVTIEPGDRLNQEDA